MKILYVSKGDHVDYQDDCLFIGLKELFGQDIIDVNKREHCYDSYPENKVSSLYGMGMTVSRVLPDLEVDRTDIANKIRTKYFDLVVYGSIWRSSADISKVLEYYPTHKVVAVDGEDETTIHPAYNLCIPYFKRELVYNKTRLHPISFAFPTSKVNFQIPKTRDVAICDPRDRSTYIYKNEFDYYNGYGESKFGITMKKAGWDCLRHYEILGNGCIPLFLNIEQCPAQTMLNFPKELCKLVNSNFNSNEATNLYEKYNELFQSHFIENNTTKALATSFINTLNR